MVAGGAAAGDARMSGILATAASCKARTLSAGTSGSMPYQYMSGRLWSSLSASCETSAVASPNVDQRRSLQGAG